MSSINKIGKKTLSINNKIISSVKRIKLSISDMSIRVKNTINEFIHQNRYDSKVNFDSKTTFLKSGKLVISNEEKNNIDNEMKESNILNSKAESLKINKLIVSDEKKNNIDNEVKEYNILNSKNESLKVKKLTLSDEKKNNIDNEMKGTNIIKFESEFLKPEIKKEKPEYNLTDKKKIVLKKGQSVLDFIELPNKDLIPIDEAINALNSCKQDSLLKSKLLLIDHIVDMQFKPLIKNKVELPNKFNSNDLKERGFDDKGYESVSFHPYEDYIFDEKERPTLSNLKNGNKQMKPKNNDKNVKSSFNENKLNTKKKKFKSLLIKITKDISLLNRLSDGDNSYGYTFLAKVSNFLEDYNGIKNKEKSNCFNKENYLNKLAKSDYFFKLNKKVNDIIYLQYLKNEQSKHKNGVVDEIIIKQPSEEEKLKETEKQK